MNLIAPTAFARFATRDGNFTADENCVVDDVVAGSVAMNDLLLAGCRHATPGDAAKPPTDPSSV
jgi:hypothetical protein